MQNLESVPQNEWVMLNLVYHAGDQPTGIGFGWLSVDHIWMEKSGLLLGLFVNG